MGERERFQGLLLLRYYNVGEVEVEVASVQLFTDQRTAELEGAGDGEAEGDEDVGCWCCR